MSEEVFRFAGFELDRAAFRLRRAEQAIHIEPRALDVLLHLIANRSRVVSKEELLDVVWGDQFVGEAAMTTALRTARLAIDDSGSEQRFIRTVHRRGYQFVGEVEVASAIREAGPSRSTDDGSSVAAAAQEIQFCEARDGTRIAYATIGSGPPLLKAANWMTHLDLEWTSPVWSHWLTGLAQRRSLTRYDERGSGLSDWDVPGFAFDDWVDDLGTVADAAGLDRFPVLGISQGAAVAISYAVRHPERVSCLVLAGAYSRGRLIRARTDEERAEAALDIELARVGWARQDPSFVEVFASQFLPDGSPEERSEFTRFQRQTTSAENAVRFLEAFAEIDVSDIAGQVECPTLIVHSRHDVRVPASQASELAMLIPNSRLVLLDSHNHLLSDAEPTWTEFLDHVEGFLDRSG